MKSIIITLGVFIGITFISCGSQEDKKQRLEYEKQERIELEEKQKRENAEREFQLEQERIEREQQLEIERIEREQQLEQERQKKEIYDTYINNSLRTGDTPYYRYYGGNYSCDEYGCSQIEVISPINSDVIVTIKEYGEVVRHAYIRAESSYVFEIPDGTYQTFFYYGKGWNPNQEMKGGKILGGFISDVHFGKDTPQYLNNDILTYTLILQRNGNFSTKPSNEDEAL